MKSRPLGEKGSKDPLLRQKGVTMAAKICSPISSPAETVSPQTELGNLLKSYIWCARAEGKSRGTIEIRITAVLALIDFLRSLRAFWSWLVSEEMVPSSPFNKVKIPRPPRKVVPTCSDIAPGPAARSAPACSSPAMVSR